MPNTPTFRYTLHPMPDPTLPHPSPRRPWAPLSNDAWSALLPYVHARSGPGRPIRELRTRLDAIFHLASTTGPWASLPQRFGKPDTVARYFRRLTHGGLWQRLLGVLADLSPAHPLRGIEHLIFRACRRAYRILGLPMVLLVRRAGLRAALPGPPWLLPDPDLSESLLGSEEQWLQRPEKRGTLTRWRSALAAFRAVLRTSLGRRRVPLFLRYGWS